MSKFMNNKLALYGGKKISKNPELHYLWPPIEKNRYSQLKKIFFKEFQNSEGYPDVVKKFENKFKKRIGMKYALALNSGTSALHAAFYALGIKKSSKVIAPSLTFHATATPLKVLEADIIFCGCEFETGNISISELKEILKNTKISHLVITHLGGHPCEMSEIMKLKKKYKFKLIEDCSHAHEARYKNKKIGTFGEIAVFSMDRNKLLSAGEGGVLVTNQRILFEKALLTSDFGERVFRSIKSNVNKKFINTGLGFKYRIHPFAAAVAYDELDNLKKYVRLRNKNLKYLTEELKKIKGVIPPVTKPYADRGAFYSYRVFLERKYFKNLTMKKFLTALNAEGLQARKTGNPPLHTLPFFKYKKKRIKSAEFFYNNTFSLPTFTFEKKK